MTAHDEADLYGKLQQTATSFIHATEFTSGSEISIEKLTTLLSPTYTQSWGHDFFVSSRPGLSPTDTAGFIKHMQSMTPMLASVQTTITDLVIDERRRKVTARVTYHMTAKGQEGATGQVVGNDIVWIISMTPEGDKVEDAVEFVDGEASRKLGELIQLWKSKQN